jgi:hypothetical protein
LHSILWAIKPVKSRCWAWSG